MPSSGIGPVPMSPFSDWKNTFTPCGTWFATNVGIPMPRLMSIPARSSWAMRFAMIVCASMVSRICDQVIDKRSGCDDVIGGDYANRDNMFCRDDHGVADHRDHRIEITCRKSIGQVTGIVG